MNREKLSPSEICEDTGFSRRVFEVRRPEHARARAPLIRRKKSVVIVISSP